MTPDNKQHSCPVSIYFYLFIFIIEKIIFIILNNLHIYRLYCNIRNISQFHILYVYFTCLSEQTNLEWELEFVNKILL